MTVDNAGVVLLGGLVLTWVSYYAKRVIIKSAFHCATPAIVSSRTCNFFYVIEFLDTVAWLTLGIICVAGAPDALNQCWRSNVMFIGSCVFVCGTISWPWLMCCYTTDYVKFPSLEEVALAITAVGAILMALAATDLYTDSVKHIVVDITTLYMVFQHVFIDGIAWVAVRHKMSTAAFHRRIVELQIQDLWE